MVLVETAHDYLTLIRRYRHAPDWEKKLLLRGDLLAACQTMWPDTLRRRLRLFWLAEAARLNFNVGEWKSWA